jgi:nickel-dependent lactate racemase
VESTTAPVIISSAGGAPYDCDLVQGKKAVLPGVELVEPGGVVILLAECPEGPGAEKTFIDWLCTKTPEEVTRDVRKRELFSLGAHGANVLARPIVEKRASVVLVTCPHLRRQIAGSYVQTAATIQEAWQMARKKCGPDPDVVICKKARRLICV